MNSTLKLLADAFYICGLSPDKIQGKIKRCLEEKKELFHQPFECEVLMRYPQDVNKDEHLDAVNVATFCFTKDVYIKEYPMDEILSFHSFVLTEKAGNCIYGACLTIYEPLYVNMQELSNGKKAVNTTTDPSCLVGYFPTAICIVSPWPFISSFEAYLRQLYQFSRQEISLDSYPIEFFIHQLVHCKVASIPCRIDLGILSPITFRFPAAQSLPLYDFPIENLFSILSIDKIIRLFSAILLEKQILLRAKNITLLTFVAETLTKLTFPFVWHYVYIPVLPDKLSYFVEAPTPFLIGLSSQVLIPQDIHHIITADLDENTIDIPDIESFSDFPEALYDLLLEEVAKAINREVDYCSGNEADTVASSMRIAFLRFFARLFRDYDKFIIVQKKANLSETSHSISDTTYDVSEHFDLYGFLLDKDEDTQEFLKVFCNTQLFLDFVLKKVDVCLGQFLPDIHYFDEFIEKFARENYLDLPLSPFALSMSSNKSDESALAERHIDLFNRVEKLSAKQKRILAAEHKMRSTRFPILNAELFPKTQDSTDSKANEDLQEDESLSSLSLELITKFSPSDLRRPSHVSAISRKLSMSTCLSSAEAHRRQSIASAQLLYQRGFLETHASFREDLLIAGVDLIKKYILFAHNIDVEPKKKSKLSIIINYSSETVHTNGHPTLSRHLQFIAQLSALLERICKHGFSATFQGSAMWTLLNFDGVQYPSQTMQDEIHFLDNFRDLKSDIGKQRAYVNLALEKQRLYEDLEGFLQVNAAIVEKHYAPYAFLRDSDNVGSILSHLDGLDAADLKITPSSSTDALPSTNILSTETLTKAMSQANFK